MMRGPRIRAPDAKTRSRLVEQAVRWIRMTPDGCTASLTEGELADDLVRFLDGSGWRS